MIFFCDIMKFNKIFLFTSILLAALSFSAVSAESFDYESDYKEYLVSIGGNVVTMTGDRRK